MTITLNASTASGLVVTPDNSGQIAFQNNGTTELTVNAFGIGLGTAVPSSGTGITFPAVQDPSSNANTLDDYEEGTWTPTFTFNNASVGLTYNFQVGLYTKVGRVVTIQCYIQMNSKGSSTGDLTINNLPFTAIATGTGNQSFCGVAVWGNALTSTSGGLAGFVQPNDTKIYLYQTRTGSIAGINNTNCGTNTDFMINATYVVA